MNIYQRLTVATFGIGFGTLGVGAVPARAALLDFKYEGGGYAGPNLEFLFNGSFTLNTSIAGTLTRQGGQGQPEEFNHAKAISDYMFSLSVKLSIPLSNVIDTTNDSALSLDATSVVFPDFSQLAVASNRTSGPNPVSDVILGFPPGLIGLSLPSDPMAYTSGFLSSRSIAYGGFRGGVEGLGSVSGLTVTPHVTSPPTSVPEPVPAWGMSVLGLLGLLKRLLRPKLDERGVPGAETL